MSAMTDNNGQDSIDNAGEIIERFGGIRPMASKMDVPVTTVQGWKKRNVIPGNRRDDVIEAAQSNNIDLSDLMAGAANENESAGTARPDAEKAGQDVTGKEERPFDLEMEAAIKNENKETEARHEDAVLTAKRRAAAAQEPASSNADMLKEISRAQSMAVMKSAWFSGILVLAVVLIAAVLLWPSKQQIEQNARDIAGLQGDVAEMEEGRSLLSGLIPDDFQQRLGQLQDQARAVEETVSTLSSRVDTIARDVMAPNVPMTTRLQRLEEHASALGAPAQLTGMLNKIQTMQQSLEGQTQLSGAIAELNILFENAKDEQALDEALQVAQQEDDALGQTLQGVAPQDLKAAALLLGLAQFRSSLHRSAPFAEDLALMQKLLGEDDPELQAAIARLAPKAASGVLTPEGLTNEFKGLAGDVVVASLKGEDVSVQEKARARFNDLLAIEKDGELITGTDTQATVARAQKMLDAGNIQGAIAELQSLEGEAAQTAQPFIDEAQLTLLAQQLQGLFTGKVLNRLGTPSATGTSGANMDQLIGEVKKFMPQRHVVKDEASGFTILEPKVKLVP